MRKLIVVLLVPAAFVAGFFMPTDVKPNCPTEDSCAIDYRDGEWHITETMP